MKQKIPYSEAMIIAEKYKKIFIPYCSRISIAGSLRRQCEMIGDVELVCIPQDLVNFSAEVNKLEKVKGEPTGKYTQRKLPEGINLDLFMATRDNWGNIFLIRTGNWQFSRQIMIRVLNRGFKQRDGYLWKGEKMLECKEEEDLFELLDIPYCPPEKRNL